MDYLLKPITFKRFMQAIGKASEKNSNKEILADTTTIFFEDSTFFKTGSVIVKVTYGSILFFEAQKEYAEIVTVDGKILIYKRMKELEREMPPMFMRIHHSYIVNIRQIKKIEDNHVWIGDRKFSISEKYRNDFLSQLKTF